MLSAHWQCADPVTSELVWVCACETDGQLDPGTGPYFILIALHIPKWTLLTSSGRRAPTNLSHHAIRPKAHVPLRPPVSCLGTLELYEV